jgi:hypothetical protein
LQAAVNPEKQNSSPSLDLSSGAIEKHILNETLQNPLTTFSAAVAVLAGLYMLAFGVNQPSLLLAAGAGFLSLATFIFNYFIRGEKLAQEYVRMQLAKQRAARENEIVTIFNEFKKIGAAEGEQAATELGQAYQKFKNFLQAHTAKGASMQTMRLQILAEETYFKGVDVLQNALAVTKALCEIDVKKLEREVQDWKKRQVENRESNALERRIELNESRITSYRQRESALPELFAECEACEAALEEAYMQFAGAEAATVLPKPNVDDAITRLETAVAAARRVEARLRNIDSGDQVYLAVGENEKK